MTIEKLCKTLSSEAGFQTVHEQPASRTLSLEGEIPAWLEGVLYRAGPGQFEVGEGNKEWKINHWFDGKSLNHRFEISGAKATVSYRSRFACDDQIAKEARLGRSNTITFSQPHDPCERLYTKFKTAFHNVTGKNRPDSASDANINVVLRYDAEKKSLITMTDTVTQQRIDPVTLEPLELFRYDMLDESLKGHLSAAHAASIDGVSYNFVLEFGPKSVYKLFSTDRSGNVKILALISDAPPAYLHSLAATENHVILTIWQADIGAMGLGVPWKNNVLDNILPWSPDRRTIHYIFNRHSGSFVKKCMSDVFFCFHHINAYETQDAIVLDLCTFKDSSILDHLRLDNARNYDALNAPMPRYQRVVLSLSEKPNQGQALPLSRPARLSVGLDLPIVNPDYQWRKARYAYGIHHTLDPSSRHMFVDAIIKLDLDSSTLDSDAHNFTSGRDYKVWKVDGMVPGEPVFVPRPGATKEDDGILLTIALDARTRSSSLVILYVARLCDLCDHF